MKNDRFLRGQESRNRDVVRVRPDQLALPPVRHVHAGLLVITLIMVCFGLVMLFSASMTDAYSSEGNALFYVLKQGSITTMGLILALFIALILPVGLFDHFWMTAALYVLTSALLAYVRFFGVVINGARRWVVIGGIQFQPSELAKIALVFCFAGYCSMVRRRRKAGKLRFKTPLRQFLADGWIDILLPGVLLAVWILVIAFQPHLSFAVIMAFILVVLFLTAGIRVRSWLSAFTQLLVLVLVVVLLGSLVLGVMPAGELKNSLNETVEENFAHVAKRLETFTNPEEASSDDRHQIRQSLIAIGSGGLTGVGLGKGRQKYNYLPEAHNDFVFAIIGEELGFLGASSIVILFLLFMLIGISITRNAANTFCALLAGGYTMLISIQAFLNIGVATETLPTTGISLPFFSYGGTSNLFFLVAIGFILAVSRTGQRLSSVRTLEREAKPGSEPASRTGEDLERQAYLRSLEQENQMAGDS